MKADDLIYTNLLNYLKPLSIKGRSESATFLNWFLENVYRLDSTSADDCLCDHTNDLGIDGIYVDTNSEEIHFFQSKIRQNDKGTIGDVEPKKLCASVEQFKTPENIELILNSHADEGIKKLLKRLEIRDLVAKGYRLLGVFVSNEKCDQATTEYLSLSPNLSIYDRNAIADSFIDSDQGVGVTGEFSFDASYVDPLEMTIADDIGANQSSVFIFPALATELVKLDGISDTTLFVKNVRYDLGNTSVNKSIRKSIETKAEHKNFPLFHNGIIILCESADLIERRLIIKNYSVVNGAQSIATFYKSKSKLSNDLRVLVRVIALNNDTLARKITEYSNNQNAIKPRDLRANDKLMTRLQNEMSETTADYFFEVKRGEVAPSDRKLIITNDNIGRVLLALDLLEPWSCHQVYKVFDEKYTQIFGRKEVNSTRILFAAKISDVVEKHLINIDFKPLAHYRLTTYFLIYVLSTILKKSKGSNAVLQAPEKLPQDRKEEFFSICSDIVSDLVIDLNYEVKNKNFDYKADLKSPKHCEELANNLMKSYEKDVARGKAKGFQNW